MTEHGAGLILYRRAPGRLKAPEYLILLSTWGKSWSVPKGHKEQGEDSLLTALRETEEETGIGSDRIQIIDGFDQIVEYKLRRPTRKCPEGVKRVRLFLAKTPYSTQVTLGREHANYLWRNYTGACVALPSEFKEALTLAEGLARKN